MSKEKSKKFPFFWVSYALYCVLLIGAVCYGLHMLWGFLDAFEATRPVHAMEAELSVFDREKEEVLKKYVTNTVENPYEDNSILYERFYERIEGKELTFGKMSGKYQEMHPVYVVLAGEEQLATVSFVPEGTVKEYGLQDWKLEAITLMDTARHSFAVTIPSSMQLKVNGKPVEQSAFTGETKTDGPISYYSYADSGLYEEPVLEVVDRFGTPVDLLKDESTGGYYYLLSYVEKPNDVEAAFGGHVLTEEYFVETGEEPENVSIIDDMAARFSEYRNIREIVSVPVMERFCIDFVFDPEEVVFTDRFGTVQTPEYDEERRTYSVGFFSDDAPAEDCVEFAYDFVEKYAQFCMSVIKKTGILPYFPEGSEYAALLSKMSTSTYRVNDVKMSNHEIAEYFAYSDNLVYIHVKLDQSFTVRLTGKAELQHIDAPLWLYKQDGRWYVINLTILNQE